MLSKRRDEAAGAALMTCSADDAAVSTSLAVETWLFGWTLKGMSILLIVLLLTLQQSFSCMFKGTF
ncbi:MAG: hypothetical protein EOP04_27270 [Proteobacteria bacterium]|nr:MAG: hypothetical protein EOP04_27270 [Pseudomonadota bacterium]